MYFWPLYIHAPSGTQKRKVAIQVGLHKKNVGACICLFVFEAYHSLNGKQSEKHPRGSIQYTVKCATETTRVSRTLRRVYATPCGSHPSNVFDRYSIVVVSKNQKQSAK